MNFTLLRHTKPAIAPGICYGQSDIACLETFPDEAHTLAQKLLANPHLHGAPILSSPLTRCSRLAQYLGSVLNAPLLRFDDRLKELNFGAWEMQAWDSIAPDTLSAWMEGYMHIAPPDGETYTELYNRCGDAIMDYVESSANTDEHHIIITHAGCIRALLAHAGGFHPGLSINFAIGYGSMTELSYTQGKWSIGYVNR